MGISGMQRGAWLKRRVHDLSACGTPRFVVEQVVFCTSFWDGVCEMVVVWARFILLEADAALTPWSRICISHADCVLLVGAEEASPQVLLRF